MSFRRGPFYLKTGLYGYKNESDAYKANGAQGISKIEGGS